MPDAGEFLYHGDYICQLEPIAETKECVVNYRDGQTYYQDHYAVNDGHNLVLYQRDITEYVDGKPVTRYESMPQESRGSFENLFGLSGYYIDTSTSHFITRTYYVPAENDGGQNVITYTMEKGAAVPSTLKMTTLVKNYVEAEHGLELDSLKATTTSEGSKATYIAVFGGAEVTVEVVEAK